MKKIKLTKGKFVIVDDCDYEWLSQWGWHYNNTGYAARKPYDKNTKTSPKTILMHRIILNAPDNMLCDHKNGNSLDNRRDNLRLCTRSQNAMNMQKKKTASSKYKGVVWDKTRKKWGVKIKINYRPIHVGRFDSEIEAAIAYDESAKQHFGEFANLNFK